MPSHRRKIFKRKKRESSSQELTEVLSAADRRKRRAVPRRSLKGAVLVDYRKMAASLWDHISDYAPEGLGTRIKNLGAPPPISIEDIKGIYAFHIKGGTGDGLLGYESKCGGGGHWSWYTQAINDFFGQGKYRVHKRTRIRLESNHTIFRTSLMSFRS